MTGINNTEPRTNNLAERIEAACHGIFYLSETDAEIRPFFAGPTEKGVREAVLRAVGELESTVVEERSFDAFFKKLTINHDWYGDSEKDYTLRFVELRKLLEKNLKNLTVVRVGRVQIDIFVVGMDADGNVAGLHTRAVET